MGVIGPVLVVLGAWLLLAVPLALLVGRMLAVVDRRDRDRPETSGPVCEAVSPPYHNAA